MSSVDQEAGARVLDCPGRLRDAGGGRGAVLQRRASSVQGVALAARRELGRLAAAMGEGHTRRAGGIRRTGYSQNRQDG
jgi:hypothetical protein